MDKYSRLRSDQCGKVNIAVIVSIIMGTLTIMAVGATVWMYGQYEQNKKINDTTLDQAIHEAKKAQKADDEKATKAKLEQPYNKYVSPVEVGSVKFDYPKTWSVYSAIPIGDDAKTSSNNGAELKAFFYPGVVPSIESKSSVYPLRVFVTADSYTEVTKQYKKYIDDGTAKASPITIKVDDNTKYEGLRIDGVLSDVANGSAVILRVRDKTMQVITDTGSENMATFNDLILKTIRFTE